MKPAPASWRLDVGAAVERVEQAEIALAGHAEQPVDAIGDQAVDDQFTNRAHRPPCAAPATLRIVMAGLVPAVSIIKARTEDAVISDRDHRKRPGDDGVAG
jgi:hypothetical protein